jgi:hypothetical protein
MILKPAVLVLAIAAAFIVFTNQGHARLQQPQPNAMPASGSTAGQSQSFKNIKVLTDLPESQLPQVMEFFAASLGRGCDFCHVNDKGQWNFAADTKPEKNTAREMIKMVLDLHKRTFPGNADISCYTCHRGSTSPVGVPQLPLPDPPRQSPTPQGAIPTPGQPLAGDPTADQLIEKYLSAVGGQTALDKLKAWTIKGSQSVSDRPGINFEMDRSTPDKFYMSLTTPQGTRELGFNGTGGWEKNARGVRDLPAVQVQGLKETLNSLWFDLARFKEQYPRIGQRVGKEKIDGHDVYVISASNPNGDRGQLMLDVQTGLPRRLNRFRPTMIGVLPAQLNFDDYRDVDGVKVAFSIEASVLDVVNPRSALKLSEVKINPLFDDSKFDKPVAPKP